MEITEITTPYERIFDQTSGGIDQRSIWASATFHTEYADLWPFMQELAGAVVEVEEGLEVRVPLRFPDTSVVDLYAERVAWRGILGTKANPVGAAEPIPGLPTAPGPAGTGWNATHPIAEIRVEFRQPEFNFQDSVFLSRRNRIGARVVTVPGAPYRYAPTASLGAGLPINQDIGIIVPTQEVRLTRHWAPNLAAIEEAVFPLIFHTNDSNLSIGTMVCPPGTVLLGGFDSDFSRMGFGQFTSRVDYSLLIDGRGWDYVMSDITGQFEPVTPTIYPRTDLGILWTL